MVNTAAENRLRTARLMVSTPETVYSELGKYGAAVDPLGLFADVELEKALLQRKDSLVDLGLAENCSDKAVWMTLYQKATTAAPNPHADLHLSALRIACYSNRNQSGLFSEFPASLIGKDALDRFLASSPEVELEALLTNPKLSENVLVEIFTGSGAVAQLSNDRRARLVLFSSTNARITTDEGSEHGPDMRYWDIHRAIVQMLATAPVDNTWRSILRRLIDRLVEEGVYRPDVSVAPILERWKQAESGEEGNAREGYVTSLPSWKEFVVIVAALFGSYSHKGEDGRFSTIILGDADSPDYERRCCFYGNGQVTKAQMLAGHGRDGEAYCLAAICNDRIFEKKDLRALLESQLSGDLASVYCRRCASLAKKWKWFDPAPLSGMHAEEDEVRGESAELVLLRSLQDSVNRLQATANSATKVLGWGLVAAVAVILAFR